MRSYTLKKRIMLTGIIISYVVCFVGCRRQAADDEPTQQNIEFTQQDIEHAQKDVEQQVSIEEEQSILQVELEGGCYVNVKIENEDMYKELINQLENYTDYSLLYLDLSETDTTIFLDEILVYSNFGYIEIKNGGIISARNMDKFAEQSLSDLELYHVSAIEEGVLQNIPVTDKIRIYLDERYEGDFALKELLNNSECTDIAILWDYINEKTDMIYDPEISRGNLKEWDYFDSVLTGKNKCLKGIYKLNFENYSYISYEFFEEDEAENWEVYICVKDRESQGEQYYDILSIPSESLSDLCQHRGCRIYINDINFDGYDDIIFVRHNDTLEVYNQCIGFLWDEEEKKFKLNVTVPRYFSHIDAERKRLTESMSSSVFEDDYYIYEYKDGEFVEKKLEVRSSRMDDSWIRWYYYEEGELTKTLEILSQPEDNTHHLLYEENGKIIEEKVLEEFLYYADIGKEYFPEFDFYNAG